jgi:hypothetical protein
MGCYAFATHVLPRFPGYGLGIDAPTAVDALRAELPDAEVRYARGCAVSGTDRSGFAAAVAAARDAEACVALVGDLAGLFGHGTSGEGCDAADLRLPGVQAELLHELLATGTPVVVVVVSGRPYALGDVHGGVHGGAAGLVQAFMPGEEGGGAFFAGLRYGETPEPIDATVARAVELLSTGAQPAEDPVTTEDVREQAEGLAASEEELVLIAMFGSDAEELLKVIRARHSRDGVLVAEDADAERDRRLRHDGAIHAKRHPDAQNRKVDVLPFGAIAVPLDEGLTRKGPCVGYEPSAHDSLAGFPFIRMVSIT